MERHTAPETVDRLTLGMSGRWRVTDAEGTEHIFDLDEDRYSRNPLIGGAVPMPGDGEPLGIWAVRVWPVVGGQAAVLLGSGRVRRETAAVVRIERVM